MTHYRISEGAALLGVSDDTVRRWVDSGRLRAQKDQAGRLTVAGVDLAAIARGEGPEEIEGGKSSVDVSEAGYWRFAAILDEAEAKMIYMDPRAHNYYQHHGRSCVNGPLDIRRMWRWLNDPAGAGAVESDAGLRPYFGEDLVVG